MWSIKDLANSINCMGRNRQDPFRLWLKTPRRCCNPRWVHLSKWFKGGRSQRATTRFICAINSTLGVSWLLRCQLSHLTLLKLNNLSLCMLNTKKGLNQWPKLLIQDSRVLFQNMKLKLRLRIKICYRVWRKPSRMREPSHNWKWDPIRFRILKRELIPPAEGEWMQLNIEAQTWVIVCTTLCNRSTRVESILLVLRGGLPILIGIYQSAVSISLESIHISTFFWLKSRK